MGKIIKIASYTFLLLCIFTSLSTLSYKNKVFADTLAPCCDEGICEAYPCSWYSSATVYFADSGCREISITCKTCVDYTVSGCMCDVGRGGSSYCLDGNERYYGGFVDCPYGISR